MIRVWGWLGFRKRGQRHKHLRERHLLAHHVESLRCGCCLLAFGTDDLSKPVNKKLMSRDQWLRFNIMRFLMERAWGRAPLEVKFETTQSVNVKYTREELAKLSLEQISQLWRDEIAGPAGLIEQPKPASG